MISVFIVMIFGCQLTKEMKPFLKKRRFFFLLGSRWCLEMGVCKRRSHVSYCVQLSWGLLRICRDDQCVLIRGCSSQLVSGGRRLLSAPPSLALPHLSVLSGLVGLAQQFASVPALAPSPGPRSMGYCFSHPGMCRQARTSGSSWCSAFCAALGEWLWLKAQLQGLACAVWVCSCEQCPAVGHAADLLQKPDWQLGSVQSRQRGISVSGGRFHLPWIGIGLP